MRDARVHLHFGVSHQEEERFVRKGQGNDRTEAPEKSSAETSRVSVDELVFDRQLQRI